MALLGAIFVLFAFLLLSFQPEQVLVSAASDGCETSYYSLNHASCSSGQSRCAQPLYSFSLWKGGATADTVQNVFKYYQYGVFEQYLALETPMSAITCPSYLSVSWTDVQMGFTCTSTGTLDVCMQWSVGFTATCTSTAIHEDIGFYTLWKLPLNGFFSQVHSDAPCDLPTASPMSCPTSCPIGSRGDGECNAACNNTVCQYDGWDCACPSACPTTWHGDGFCDSACKYKGCNYDNGDCVKTLVPAVSATECPTACPTSWRGDGVCDSVCKSAACNFDGGDCEASNQLSGGAIAGIVIGSIAALALIAILILMVVRRNGTNQTQQHKHTPFASGDINGSASLPQPPQPVQTAIPVGPPHGNGMETAQADRKTWKGGNGNPDEDNDEHLAMM